MEVVAWISGNNVKENGDHMGRFGASILYDRQNLIFGFLRNAEGPIPGKPEFGGTPGIPGFEDRPGWSGFAGGPGRHLVTVAGQDKICGIIGLLLSQQVFPNLWLTLYVRR